MNWNGLELPDNPYYQDNAVVIYHGDCRDILPHLPKVDLVLTDPPYGISLDLHWLSQIHLAQGKPANKTDKPIIGDEGIDLSFLWQYPRRVVFGFPYIYDLQATGWLVWDKQPGLLDTDRTMTSPVEIASTTVWRGFKLVRCMWAGFLRDNGEYRFEHPTQKPLKVIKYVIKKTTEETNLILDPFMGSGTTLRAAKDLGRKAIGIEIEEKYCEIAAKRMSQTVMELRV